MKTVLFIISGILGGILGGMGMGGGTVLIPLLSFICGLEQHMSQAINLLSFIPMATVSLIIHLKNKLIDFNNIFYIILPAILTTLIGAYLSKDLDGEILKRLFGGFLTVLSAIQFYLIFKKQNKK